MENLFIELLHGMVQGCMDVKRQIKKLHNTRLSRTRLTAIILNISLRTSFKTKTLSLGLNAKPWNEKKRK